MPEELAAAFQPATRADLAQLVGLRQQVIGTELTWDDSSYLSWRYHFGLPDRGMGECWVVKHGGEILSMVGSERIRIQYQGRAVAGLSVMDIAVRPDIEGVGLGVWMAMHLCERSACVLAIGSNDRSRAIVSRVLSRLPDRRQYAHIIDFGPALRRRFGIALPTTIAALLAKWGMTLWRAGVMLVRDRSLQIEPLTRFDSTVNDLIAHSQAACSISLERSDRFLNWRLFDYPRSRYVVLAAHDATGMAGYMAFRIKEFNDGSKVLFVKDFLVRAGSSGAVALQSLICRGFEEALSGGCERISVTACHPDNERVLRRLGFFPLRTVPQTLSVRCNDSELNDAIVAGVPWHLTGANTDRHE